MIDDKLEKELKLKKNSKTFNFLNGFRETSIFIDNIRQGLDNDFKDKLYINTESNIFSVFSVKNENEKKRLKTFNLNNYEKIFYKNREKNFLTLKEEKNAEIIKNIFDLIKIRKIKKETIANKTALAGIGKNKLTKYQINNTFTNPDAIRIISDKIHKNKRDKFLNNLSYEKDLFKTRTLFPEEIATYPRNSTISNTTRKFPNIIKLKNDILNLDKTAKKFNENFITKIKFMNTNSIDNKKNFNISLIKPNKLSTNSFNYYEDENNKNFIKNKKYFNHYIKKLSTYKYNNNIINKFFENKNKDKDKENLMEQVPKVKRKIEVNDDEYYYLHEKPKHQSIPILNKINKIKKIFRCQVDKEIFDIFNKKI